MLCNRTTFIWRDKIKNWWFHKNYRPWRSCFRWYLCWTPFAMRNMPGAILWEHMSLLRMLRSDARTKEKYGLPKPIRKQVVTHVKVYCLRTFNTNPCFLKRANIIVNNNLIICLKLCCSSLGFIFTFKPVFDKPALTFKSILLFLIILKFYH